MRARHRLQYAVAHDVTEAIVDLLEAVDVERDQRQLAAIAIGAPELAQQRRAEAAPVGQCCQLVGARQQAQALIGPMKLGRQVLNAQHGAHAQLQLEWMNRLDQNLVGAHLDAVRARRRIAERREQDDGHERPRLAADLPHHRVAVHAGHHHVEQHQRRAPLFQVPERVIAGRGFEEVVAVALEDGTQERANLGVVIHDQNRRAHTVVLSTGEAISKTAVETQSEDIVTDVIGATTDAYLNAGLNRVLLVRLRLPIVHRAIGGEDVGVAEVEAPELPHLYADAERAIMLCSPSGANTLAVRSGVALVSSR